MTKLFFASAAGLLALVAAGCELNLRPGSESILEAINTERSPGELAAMAIDPYDPNSRYVGTLGLANAFFASEPVYIRLFEDNIDDEDPAVRAAAARGLANHGEPSHVPLLITSLQDPSTMVRIEAARGLQRLHAAEAALALIQASREPDSRVPTPTGELSPEVRAEAAHALGQYATPAVLQNLIASLDDSDLSVNRSAQESLQTLTGQDFGVDRGAWAAWLARTQDPFAGQRMYVYPVFNRPYRFYEHLPLVPKPPNETAAPPAGLPRG